MKHTLLVTCLCVLILISATLLRLWDLGGQSYWMDEGFTVVAVQAIQNTGTQILASGYSYTCPLYCYPSAAIADALGNTPSSYRLLAALAGSVFIAVIFFGSRQWFGSRIALLTTFFAATSFFQIAWSRQARWYTLFELFFWLSVFFFYRALYTKERRLLYAALSVATGASAILTHELGYLLPLIFGTWMLIDAVTRKLISKKLFLGICAGGLIAAGGLALYLTPKVSFMLPFYLSFYLRSYWVLIVLSLIAAFHPDNPYRRETSFLGLILVAYIVPLSFLSDIVNYRYLFHVTPVLFMLGAIGVFAVMSDLARSWQKMLVIPIILLIYIGSGQGVLVPQTNYFLESDNPESALLPGRKSFIFVPQPNWSGAYAHVGASRQPGDVIVSTQSQFNSIYLDTPGYWIRYSYNGKDYMKETSDGRDFYAGAVVIGDLAQLTDLATSTHGYVLIDVYAKNHIPEDIRLYIEQNFEEVFHERTNAYSEVWVYRF